MPRKSTECSTSSRPRRLFPGGDRQQMAALAQVVQHGQHPGKQAQVVLVLQVMKAVAVAQLLVLFGGTSGAACASAGINAMP